MFVFAIHTIYVYKGICWWIDRLFLYLPISNTSYVENDIRNLSYSDICFYTGLWAGKQRSLGTCSPSIGTNCKNASLVIDQSEWTSCATIQLYWNYPKDNLTITFIPLRNPRPYRFCLEPVGSTCAQTFRVLENGTSNEVTWRGPSSACFRNEDGVDYFKFRFQGPGYFYCFGVYIRFSFA